MVLLYLLIPGFLGGVWSILKQHRPEGFFLLIFILFMAIPISVVVANLGTLFRLRLLFLLPMLIIAAAGDPLRLYQEGAQWLRWGVQQLGGRRADGSRDRAAASLQPAPSTVSAPALTELEERIEEVA